MGIISRALAKKETLSAVLLIIILTSLVYANSLRNSFSGDDFSIIVNNDFIRSWKNFPLIFSPAYLTASGENTYRPAVTISYFIDYSLWRLRPFGYHLSNLILHLGNVILLYFLLGPILKNNRTALLACLFFGLHPVNSEAVNAITFREDLLAFFFFISSFILFIRSGQGQGKNTLWAYFGSLALYLLALFSKEMAISLPLLLILYDYYFVFPQKPRQILTNLKSRYLGYIPVSLFYLGVRFLLIRSPEEALLEYPQGSFYINLLTMPKVLVTYMGWLFFPAGIHVTLRDAAFFSSSLFNAEVLFSISTIIASFLLALVLYRKEKAASFGIIWFFTALLPVFNIIPIANPMAVRYLYIPAAGFCLLLAWMMLKLPQRTARYAVVGLMIFYSCFTVVRGFAWRNNITLWLEAVEYYPDNAFARRGLGDCFRKSGLSDKAIIEYRRAVDLDPEDAKTYNILGICYGEKRLYRKALAYFKRAVEIDPDYAEAYNNLGTTYANMKNWTEAEKAFKKTLEIDPEYKPARDSLKKLRGTASPFPGPLPHKEL